MVVGADQHLSFLMGADGLPDGDLASVGVSVLRRSASGHRELLVPARSLDAYRNLLRRHLVPGYWNETVGRDAIQFLFKLADGRVQVLALSEVTRARIAALCSALNGDPIERTSDVAGYLWANQLYRDTLAAFHGVSRGTPPPRSVTAGAGRSLCDAALGEETVHFNDTPPSRRRSR